MAWILTSDHQTVSWLNGTPTRSVCVLADKTEKLQTITSTLHPQYQVSQILLNSVVDDVCASAMIIDVDLTEARNVDEVRRVLSRNKSAQQRVFIVDSSVRVSVIQAYAIGATNILFSPVDAKALQYALRQEGVSLAVPATAVSRCSAAMGSMFAATIDETPIKLMDAENATNQVIESIAGSGLTAWLSTVRRYHEGTFQHCMLVTGIAVDFAMSLGFSSADVKRLGLAATLHDVGKAKIPVAILDKPGRLDDGERAIMQDHPRFGYEALECVKDISGEVLDAVRHHHEYLDGTGYPDCLQASQISDLVRLLTISDIFAALIESRSYKPPLPGPQAYNILCDMDGKLERALVAAFKAVAMRC